MTKTPSPDTTGTLPLVRQKLLATLSAVLSHKLELLLLSLMSSLMLAAAWVRDYLAPLVPQPAEQWAVLTTAAGLAGLLLGAASFFLFRPKFRHVVSIGVHQDIKTGAYFCSHCLLTSKLHSPMYLGPGARLWNCSVCGKSRRNPDYKASEEEADTNRTWMAY